MGIYSIPLFFILLVSLSSSCLSPPIGYVKYTVDLGNFTVVQGSLANIFSQISPSELIQDSQGRVFVAAVGSVYVLGPYDGKILRQINVSGAEYMTYDPNQSLIYVASGTLPNMSISVISDETLTLLRTVGLNVSPTGIVYDQRNGEIYVGFPGGLGELRGNELSPSLRVDGVVTSIAVNPLDGDIYVTTLNFSENQGYLYSISPELTVNRVVELNTFPNVVTFWNGKIYVGGDGYLEVFNASSLEPLTSLQLQGQKVEGIAVDPRDGFIYVSLDSLYGPDSVLAFAGNETLGEIGVGVSPKSVLYDTVSGEIFVSNFFDGTISIIAPGCPVTQSVTENVTINRPSITPAPAQTPSYLLPMLVVALTLFLALYLVRRKG
ncbi:hypothetical protein MetMK1DRAFT_00005600 [Metallosphaera yellowstonensis MK1]|jgi:DNA-binding beta-propeller fold protein YncE|uniref:Streptogramin lyase n=1 Tax=Metallosphaera yellowstonensis MK1 TaxID=671065 RepID=H2C1D7_9CREN|nr:hypothetical protein [Metallosphaera yellowstonensis]EHP70058.1 hypothetical protein MetMK1DRAFT_00005600 [Metallosphaera yellowstonensis MK1]